MPLAPFRILLLLLIVIAVVAFLAYLLRGRWPFSLARRPRKRHIVVRVVCGVLGAAILGAIAIGTWHEVQRCYAAEEPAPALTVRVPTLPPPAPPATFRPDGTAEIEKARLLFTFVVAEFEAGELRPVAAGQQEVRWPEEWGRRFQKEFEVGDSSFCFGLQVTSLRWSREGADRVAVKCSGSHELRSRYRGNRGGGNSYAGGDFDLSKPWLRCYPIYGMLGVNAPLSIASGPDPASAVWHFVWGAPVAEGDPLTEIEVAAFLGQHEAEVRQALVERGVTPNWRLAMAHPDEHAPAPGLRLAGHIGISGLLLIAAALLLTQLFVRRSLAFVGVLAAVVLYVAALDRIALGTHLSHLRDATEPVRARLTACCHATDSFFYRKTALACVRAVADDPQAPSALRDVAQEADRVLSRAW